MAGPDLGHMVEDFPVLEREIDGLTPVYLDSAATSLTPRSVIAAIVDYYSNVGANIHRGRHRLSEEASDAFEATRIGVAEYIGAAPNETIFVRNTTEALNLVCSGLGLAPTDTVVVSDDAHHSNLLPWRDRGRVAPIRVLASGEPDLDHYLGLLRLRPRVVALTHCSNVSGVIAPLREMARLAHDHGAIVVADLAQSIPHRRLRMRELEVDFAAFSAHKMLGPTGIGVLYGREDRLTELRPALLGGGMVDWVDDAAAVLRDLPHRFEAGTPDIAGAYGFGAAVRYLDSVGPDALEAHDRDLAAVLRTGADERDYLHPIDDGTAADRCAILSVQVDGAPKLDDLATTLSDSYGVMCRSGFLCAQPFVSERATTGVLRASPYIYNTRADVARLFAALDEIVAAQQGTARSAIAGTDGRAGAGSAIRFRCP
jgi:cysteine desulfurase/selenocysteine lyase